MVFPIAEKQEGKLWYQLLIHKWIVVLTIKQNIQTIDMEKHNLKEEKTRKIKGFSMNIHMEIIHESFSPLLAFQSIVFVSVLIKIYCHPTTTNFPPEKFQIVLLLP